MSPVSLAFLPVVFSFRLDRVVPLSGWGVCSLSSAPLMELSTIGSVSAAPVQLSPWMAIFSGIAACFRMVVS